MSKRKPRWTYKAPQAGAGFWAPSLAMRLKDADGNTVDPPDMRLTLSVAIHLLPH